VQIKVAMEKELCIFCEKTVKIKIRCLSFVYYNGVSHNMYSLSDIVRMIKLWLRDEWGMWHAWGEMKNAYRILVGKLEQRGYMEDLSIEGRM
jgi:hypothetical protein